MADTLKGSCLCGSVAYEVKDPQAMGYCHCTRCQRWTGSHLAGVVVAKENFTLTDGDDVIETYESEFAPRNFCGNCGSAIYDGAPLQRRLRDAFTATAHFQVNEASRELPGRILLGQTTEAAML